MTARIVYLSTGRRYDPDDHSWTVEPPYGPRISLMIAEVYPDVEIEHGASVQSPETVTAINCAVAAIRERAS